MARLTGEIPLPELAISAGSTYWLWGVQAPAHQRILVPAWFVGQNYNTNGTPGLLGFYWATSLGTGGTSATPQTIDQDTTETFQSTCVTNIPNATPPAGTSLIREVYINPQVSVPEYLPLHEEFALKGGGFFVVKFQPQASGNVAGWLRIQE